MLRDSDANRTQLVIVVAPHSATDAAAAAAANARGAAVDAIEAVAVAATATSDACDVQRATTTEQRPVETTRGPAAVAEASTAAPPAPPAPPAPQAAQGAPQAAAVASQAAVGDLASGAHELEAPTGAAGSAAAPAVAAAAVGGAGAPFPGYLSDAVAAHIHRLHELRQCGALSAAEFAAAKAKALDIPLAQDADTDRGALCSAAAAGSVGGASGGGAQHSGEGERLPPFVREVCEQVYVRPTQDRSSGRALVVLGGIINRPTTTQ